MTNEMLIEKYSKPKLRVDKTQKCPYIIVGLQNEQLPVVPLFAFEKHKDAKNKLKELKDEIFYNHQQAF